MLVSVREYVEMSQVKYYNNNLLFYFKKISFLRILLTHHFREGPGGRGLYDFRPVQRAALSP